MKRLIRLLGSLTMAVLLVVAIAEERGVAVPSFLGYLAWSVPILLPLFALVAWIFL